MKILFCFAFSLIPLQLYADLVVPKKTIRANTVLLANDLMINRNIVGNGLRNLSDVVGREARVVLYAGRPIRGEDIGPPAIIRRNQLVPMEFLQSGLKITAVGRALDRGAEGDIIRLMNVASRSTLFGTVTAEGTVNVSQGQ